MFKHYYPLNFCTMYAYIVNADYVWINYGYYCKSRYSFMEHRQEIIGHVSVGELESVGVLCAAHNKCRPHPWSSLGKLFWGKLDMHLHASLFM